MTDPTKSDITPSGLLEENERRKTANRLAIEPGTRHAHLDDATRQREDFAYWASTRAYIKSKEEGIEVLFRLNRAQRKLVDALERMRRAEKPIRLILLKARQWGGSTCVQLYMAWLQLIHREGLNSLIIAHQGSGTDEIKDMFDRMVKNYPRNPGDPVPEDGDSRVWTMEGVGRSRSIFRLKERRCKIKVGSAERPDSCRGGDYSLVHCSEVGIWKATAGKTPEMLLRSACSGVLLRPMTMIVYESTANGTGNFFHREYEAAARGESQFEPLFVAWYEIDQYSLPLDDPEAFARRLIEGRNEEAAPSLRSQPGAYLWWLWERGATLEAINWYISERSKYSDHGLMAAEYPSDDVEAFVHSGARVFDKYKVEALREGCRLLPETGQIDIYDGQVHNLSMASEEQKREWLEQLEFRTLESGGWKIWRRPGVSEEGGTGRYTDRYVVAVDVGGRSRQSDWSVIAVFDRLPMRRGEGPEVVAQWRGHTDFDLLAWEGAKAAKYYEDALLVIESNTLETRDPDRSVEGNQSLSLLERLRNIYDNLYARAGSPEDISMGRPARYGFHTNANTKPLIITNLVECIREGLYIERDGECLDEFLAYEQRPDSSYGAIPGCHDDMLMTRAIGLYICRTLDIPRRYEDVPRITRHPLGGYGYW